MKLRKAVYNPRQYTRKCSLATTPQLTYVPESVKCRHAIVVYRVSVLLMIATHAQFWIFKWACFHPLWIIPKSPMWKPSVKSCSSRELFKICVQYIIPPQQKVSKYVWTPVLKMTQGSLIKYIHGSCSCNHSVQKVVTHDTLSSQKFPIMLCILPTISQSYPKATIIVPFLNRYHASRIQPQGQL
jgi:hypothetical protein